MARKKQKKFSAVKTVKAVARETLGTPPPTRRDPTEREKKAEKAKPTLKQLLDEDE